MVFSTTDHLSYHLLYSGKGTVWPSPIFKRLYNGKGPLRFLLVFFIAGNLISMLVASTVVLSIGLIPWFLNIQWNGIWNP